MANHMQSQDTARTTQTETPAQTKIWNAAENARQNERDTLIEERGTAWCHAHPELFDRTVEDRLMANLTVYAEMYGVSRFDLDVVLWPF